MEKLGNVGETCTCWEMPLENGSLVLRPLPGPNRNPGRKHNCGGGQEQSPGAGIGCVRGTGDGEERACGKRDSQGGWNREELRKLP